MKTDDAAQIGKLTEAIVVNPTDVSAWLQRGKLHYRSGSFGAAANDFAEVLSLNPTNTEAEGYLHMLDEIQNYRNIDMLNP